MADKLDKNTADANAVSLVGYEDAARFLCMPLGTVYSLVSKGQVPHIRISRRLVRFDLGELRAWIDARRVPAKAASSYSDR
jgi:excisionase family DNA binding protein